MGDNEVNRLFEKFEIANKLFQRDGAVDETLYAAADVKILWVLKQDWVGPDKYGDSFCERIKGLAKDKGIQGSPTWRRMAQVSYGILHDVTNFDDLPECALAQGIHSSCRQCSADGCLRLCRRGIGE